MFIPAFSCQLAMLYVDDGDLPILSTNHYMYKVDIKPLLHKIFMHTSWVFVFNFSFSCSNANFCLCKSTTLSSNCDFIISSVTSVECNFVITYIFKTHLWMYIWTVIQKLTASVWSLRLLFSAFSTSNSVSMVWQVFLWMVCWFSLSSLYLSALKKWRNTWKYEISYSQYFFDKCNCI